ncbi:MAG: hypothetical protein AAGJ46_08260 [Planctomycetota bacterium]
MFRYARLALFWCTVAASGVVFLVSAVMWPRSYFYTDMMAIKVSEGHYASAGLLSDGGVWMYVIPSDGPPWPNNRVPWEEQELRTTRKDAQDSYGHFLPWWNTFNPRSSGSFVVVPYYLTVLATGWVASLAVVPPHSLPRLLKHFRMSLASLLILMTFVAIVVAASVNLGNGVGVIAFEGLVLLFLAITAIRRARRSTGPAQNAARA